MLSLNRLFCLYMGPLLYYDFYVGEPKSNPIDWKYQPWKICAKSPRQAAFFKMFIISDFKKAKPEDVLVLAFMSVRVIVEFELTNRQGKTKYRFKKKAEYRIQDNLKII